MSDNVILRLTFKADSAEHFLLEEQIATGQYVVERDDYTLNEAYDFLHEFSSCLEEALVLIDGKKVVTLSDFQESV